MENFQCAFIIVFFLPVFMIVLGSIYIFKKDLAWRIVESLLSNVKPQRTAEWDVYSTINGIIMLVGGILLAIFLVSKLSE